MNKNQLNKDYKSEKIDKSSSSFISDSADNTK